MIQLKLMSGSYSDAVKMARAQEDWVRSNHRTPESESLNMLGYSEYMLGDYHAAEEHLVQSLKLSRAHGRVTQIATLRETLAVVCDKIGKHDLSDQCIDRIESDKAGLEPGV